MRLQRQSNGQPIAIDNASELGAGGEARVFALPADPTLVAKVYRKPKPLYDRKLAVMVANPPDNPTASQDHLSFAWPVDLLLTGEAKPQVVGFLMPRVTGMRPLIDFYNPKTRRTRCPLFNYLYLHRTARNLAAAVNALHARGYAIGDVNESNILLTNTALCTFVDMDSVQVTDPDTGEVYRCPVGKPEFTPPQLQGQSFAKIDRSPEDDLFGLAVLIFQLLMEGTHPFAGVYKLPGEPPPIEKRIVAGHFPYGSRQVPFHPMLAAPAFELLHPTLRQLFLRCFEDGHRYPQARPTAQSWQRVLKEAENALVTCSANEQHRYGSHLSSCPWCARARALGGRDPFPSVEAVQRGQHLKPLVPKKIPILPAPIQSIPAKVYAQVHQYAGTPQLPQTTSQTNAGVPASKQYAYGRLGKPPRLELNLPPVNPLLAGLFILVLAFAGVWYGREPATQLAKPLIPKSSSIQKPTIEVSLAKSIQYQAAAVGAIAISPDSKILASNRDDGSILLWNLNLPDVKPLRILSGKSAVSAIAISPDGTILASVSRSDDRVKLWQLETGKPLGSIPAEEGVVSLAISSKQQILVTGSRDTTLKLWNLSNSTRRLTFDKWNAGWVNAVAISPNQQILAAGTETGSVYVVDLNRLQEKGSFKEAALPVESVAFTPNGRVLAASQSRQINLWNLSTGQLQDTLVGHSGEVRAIAISPDGRILASGGADNSIRIWDLATSELLGTLNKNDDEILSLTFSPDGKILASGGANGTIKLWQVARQ